MPIVTNLAFNEKKVEPDLTARSLRAVRSGSIFLSPDKQLTLNTPSLTNGSFQNQRKSRRHEQRQDIGYKSIPPVFWNFINCMCCKKVVLIWYSNSPPSARHILSNYDNTFNNILVMMGCGLTLNMVFNSEPSFSIMRSYNDTSTIFKS